MKFTVKILFIMLCLFSACLDVGAEMLSCPEGCFCLNEGQFDSETIFFGSYDDRNQNGEGVKKMQELCQGSPTPVFDKERLVYKNAGADKPFAPEGYACFVPGYVWIGAYLIICNRDAYSSGTASGKIDKFNYFIDEFSELYYDPQKPGEYLGGYGRIGNDIIYFPSSAAMQKVFRCPVTHPLSDSGAKKLTDCYRYSQSNNKKIYYGTTPTVSVTAQPDISATDIAKQLISAGVSVESNVNQNNNTTTNTGVVSSDKPVLKINKGISAKGLMRAK
ncbi:MAG: hypothetical protein IJL05_03665 [Alphaproteobacteria bacterium]|nr:hypothetical protein [Alphaproteobacteria bacterium]